MFLLETQSFDNETPVYIVYDTYNKAKDLAETMQQISEEIGFIGDISIYRMISLDWESLFEGRESVLAKYGDDLIVWENEYYRLQSIESWTNIE